MKKFILISILILESTMLFSQNRNVLKVVSEELNKEQKRMFSYKAEHPDSISAVRELQKLLFRFRAQSYVLASADTLYKTGDTIYAHCTMGSSWQWAKLRQGNVHDQILNKSGYREKFYSNTSFKYSDLVKFQKEMLNYSQDHGYPFATINLDSIHILNSNRVEASLNYQPGPLIFFDSISIIGKTKIKKRFLTRYLRIFPGQPYSQEKVNAINKMLKELPYLRQSRPLAITFNQDKAIVHLFLEDRRSNQVDGIIGFLPNESAKKKLLLTGEVNLHLKNLFGTGKSLGAEWRKFDQASQLLNISYLHPRIIATNLDVKVDFNLFKQDTSFLNVSRRITVFQGTNRYGRLNFFGGLNTSRELISSKIPDKTSLPPFSNYNHYIYGLGYDWANLNDLFYPRKGWFVSAQSLIGNKSILKSTGFEDSLYNKVQLKSVQLNVNLKVERFFRIGKSSTLLSRVEGGHIFNNQKNIFFNDMYRIGGLRSLRGFNENNFYASTYGLATLEYRFFTDETSYLLLFFDQAYIKNPMNTAIPSDYPFGFGAGVSFSTKAGVFHFIYSLGSAKSQELSFNLSKIHFGIISRF